MAEPAPQAASGAPAPTSGAADSTDSPGPSWTRWFTLASIAVALIALVVTVWSVGPHRLFGQLRAIGWGFAVVLALELVITICDSRALHGFLHHTGRHLPFLHVLRAQIAGRAINAVTPLSSLGEAAKATTLMEKTSSRRAIAAVFHYNLASIGVKLVTIVVGAPLCALLLDLPRALAIALYIGSAVAGASLIAGVLLSRRGMLMSLVDAGRALRVLSKARAGRWRQMVREIDRLPHRGGARSRWTPTLWVIASRILGLVSMWAVLFSVGYTAGPKTVAAIATAGALITAIASVVPMGLGISEGSNAALFVALGAPGSLGVTMVLGGRITTLAYAVLGLILLGASSAVDLDRTRARARAARSRQLSPT